MGYSSPTHKQKQQPQEQSTSPSWGGPIETEAGAAMADMLLADREQRENEKTMEESTTATAPTLVTGQSHGPGDLLADEEEDDATTIRSQDSLVLGRGTGELDDHHHHHNTYLQAASAHAVLPGHGNAEAASTCSASTAPSTDEASSMGGMGDWLHYTTTAEPIATGNQRLKQPLHRRTPSWEVSPRSLYHHHASQPASALALPSSSHSPGWQGQHVASFRNDHSQQGGGITTNPVSSHGHGTPPRPRNNTNTAELPYLPRVGHNNADTAPRGMHQRPNNLTPATPTPHSFHSINHQTAQQRRQFHGPPLPPSTPPRPTTLRSTNRPAAVASPHRVLTNTSSSQLHPSQNVVPTGPRSSSEVLKTLLRKKACLYEADTSRAVALVTWLVGRELALQQGFFSRQQLQSGVHACVATKIDSGVITRTKVNRCMQIILNSCFHYIIPRPDGSEENGSCMRETFAREMFDDSFMLTCLPAPWNDLIIDFDHNGYCDDNSSVRTPAGKYETPHSSPRFGSVQQQEMESPGRDSLDGDESETKRAVLLCFNENVRSAADVFRCHNEFIRDTSHSCNLQLSSNEWRQFFGSQAASAPHVWANIGIPVPSIVSNTRTDALGMFTPDEVAHLRTSWCSKRYDHDHNLCGFAHPQVNGGWLRRNPNVYTYCDEMCPFVSKAVLESPDGNKQFFVNTCPKGKDCEFAHSREEIVYHPKQYKTRSCASSGPCSLCEVCPHFHSWDVYRFPRKSDAKAQRHGRHGGGGGQSGKLNGTNATVQMTGAPIVMAGDAPLSSFEESMQLPGLQALYRMQSNAVLRFLVGKNDSLTMQSSYYSLFDRLDLNKAKSPKSVERHLERKIVGLDRSSC